MRFETSFDIKKAVQKLTNDIVEAAKVATPIAPKDGNHEITYPLEIRASSTKARRSLMR